MNQILTDEEVSVITGIGFEATGRAIEQAVLNKLSGQKPVCYGNQTALDNMLDDRVAEVAGVRDGWRKTPLYLHPAPSAPEGYVMVPVEPTEAMIYAGREADRGWQYSNSEENGLAVIYKAMLSARSE